MVQCPKCSTAVTEVNARHCSNCGAPLHPAPTLQPESQPRSGAVEDKRTRFGYAVMKPPTAQPAPHGSVSDDNPLIKTRPDPPRAFEAPSSDAPISYDSPLFKTQIDVPTFDMPARGEDAPVVYNDPLLKTSIDPQPLFAAPEASRPAPAPAPGTTAPALQGERTVEVTPPEAAPAKAAPAQKTAPPAPERAKAPRTAPAAAPGKTALRVLMILWGLALLGAFAAPVVKADGKLVFSWDLLGSAAGLSLVTLILPAAGGLLCLLAGLIPLPHVLRALIAFLVGAAPLVLGLTAGAAWQVIVVTAMLVLLPAALMHRARVRGSVLARILVAVGVLGILATFLVPAFGTLPVASLLAGLGALDAPSLVVRLLPLVLILLCLLSLLAFMGRRRTGLSRLWAVLLLLYLPLQALLPVVVRLAGGADFMASLGGLVQGLASLGFLVLASSGLGYLLTREGDRLAGS
jgi:hypothetical protein